MHPLWFARPQVRNTRISAHLLARLFRVGQSATPDPLILAWIGRAIALPASKILTADKHPAAPSTRPTNNPPAATPEGLFSEGYVETLAHFLLLRCLALEIAQFDEVKAQLVTDAGRYTAPTAPRHTANAPTFKPTAFKRAQIKMVKLIHF